MRNIVWIVQASHSEQVVEVRDAGNIVIVDVEWAANGGTTVWRNAHIGGAWPLGLTARNLAPWEVVALKVAGLRECREDWASTRASRPCAKRMACSREVKLSPFASLTHSVWRFGG